MIVVGINANPGDDRRLDSLGEHRVASNQFLNVETGSGHANCKLRARQHLGKFDEQSLRREKRDPFLERRIKQLRGSVAPQ